MIYSFDLTTPVTAKIHTDFISKKGYKVIIMLRIEAGEVKSLLYLMEHFVMLCLRFSVSHLTTALPPSRNCSLTRGVNEPLPSYTVQSRVDKYYVKYDCLSKNVITNGRKEYF